jgi:hypothetical protein
MSKLNYGPRYGTTVVSANYHYDDTLDRDMREINAHIQARWKNAPQYLHEQATEKAQATKRRRKAALGTGRQDAELRMATALREAVALLEFHMADMMANRIRPGDHSSVNQLQIANALHHLKHKCGLDFADDAYRERVPLYEYEPSLLPQRDANLDERLKAQREARIKRRQRIIDKLIARPKKGAT